MLHNEEGEIALATIWTDCWIRPVVIVNSLEIAFLRFHRRWTAPGSPKPLVPMIQGHVE